MLNQKILCFLKISQLVFGDFENIVILDRASNALKLQYKEMLYIRKLNPSLNRQMNSELFSFVIRNAIKDSDITKDIQKYLKSNKNEKRS